MNQKYEIFNWWRVMGLFAALTVAVSGFFYYHSVWMSPSPLFRAIGLNDMDGVIKYVKRGVDVNYREKTGWYGESQGVTPLTFAVFHADGEMINFLVNNGAFINYPDGFGWTPAFYAAYRGDPEIIDLLAINGADFSIQCEGVSTVEKARECGHLQAADSIQQMLNKSQEVPRK